MRSILNTLALLLSTTIISAGQVPNAAKETVKVYGNCGDCKVAIEKAGSRKGLNLTIWDAGSQMATITYDSKKTSSDAVLKSIALAGYDSDSYMAPDDMYEKLQGCCKYERRGKSAALVQPANSSKEDHPGHQPGMPMGGQQASQLKMVYDQYFMLKDALVRSDGNIASAAAGDLVKALAAVEMTKLNTAEHAIWMKMEKQVKMDADHIRENKEIGRQRQHFITLSAGIYELVKASKPAEAVYYQHCPMANDGKGAHWLSRESSIKNPYYGSQMLTCGKTVETIRQ